MNDFEQCLKLTFNKFSVARKPIINGGAIRPGGLLFKNLVGMLLGSKAPGIFVQIFDPEPIVLGVYLYLYYHVYVDYLTDMVTRKPIKFILLMLST